MSKRVLSISCTFIVLFIFTHTLFSQDDQQTGLIDGTVYRAADSAVIANAMVILYGRSGTGQGSWKPVDTATTSATGTYAFEKVQTANNYRLGAFTDGYLADTVMHVQVTSNDTTTVNFYLQEHAYGSLCVYVGKEGDNSPIGGASVTSLLLTQQALVTIGKTGQNGWIVWDNVLTGSYSITAAGDGYQTKRVTTSVANSEKDTVRIAFQTVSTPNKFLTGTVVNTKGAPVENALITLQVGGSGMNTYVLAAQTNTSGVYTLIGIPPQFSSGNALASATGYRDTLIQQVKLDSLINVLNIVLTPESVGIFQTKHSQHLSVTTPIYVNNRQLYIPGTDMASVVTIYTVNGRILLEKTFLHHCETVVLPVASANQLLLVKVKRSDNSVQYHRLVIR